MRKSILFKAAVVLAVLLFAGGVVFAADVVVSGSISGAASLSFGASTINLGVLDPGVEKTGTVTITESTNSPSGYTVTVASTQAFNLRLYDGTQYVNTGSVGEVIPYTIRYGVSGSEISYSPTGTTPFTLTDTTTKPQNNSVTKNFIVVVTAEATDSSGNFQDELTFTIVNK
jgi:hypothetical protein